MLVEDIAANEAMGKHGAVLLPASGGILTHCNAGALATCGYGTALGVIRAAVESGKKLHVFADETRPFLQGSRLTAWELMKDGIPTTVISDNMAGAIMRQGKIDAVIVGADRIAANGDVANKIGTYTVAVLAKEHGIPFYVAAPFSTVDLETPDGSRIPIEQRAPEEVTHLAGKQIAPDGVKVENPAFDVTPHGYVAAIITERGIARAPYAESLRELAEVESHEPEAFSAARVDTTAVAKAVSLGVRVMHRFSGTVHSDKVGTRKKVMLVFADESGDCGMKHKTRQLTVVCDCRRTFENDCRVT